MTRLKTNDIHHIVAALADYDKALIDKTGRSLRGVACYAVGVDGQCGSEVVIAVRCKAAAGHDTVDIEPARLLVGVVVDGVDLARARRDRRAAFDYRRPPVVGEL